MRPFAHLPIAAALALSFPSELLASTASLEIDGRFYVQGAGMRTARVILENEGQAPQVYTDDIRHLKIELDLQEVYTLTFEREGCRTKAILFDTRMGQAEAAFAPFAFHFDVTLEVVGPDSEPYAGPVGYVSYRSITADFGYDLDYRLTHDEKGRLLADAGRSTESVISGRRARAERIRVRPFIDPTLAMEREAAAKAGVSDEGFSFAMPTEGISTLAAAVKPRYAEEDMERSVIVEQDREITIVRVGEGTDRADYRRIMHSNGTVLHYRNGSNCSYLEYIAAVGRP